MKGRLIFVDTRSIIWVSEWAVWLPATDSSGTQQGPHTPFCVGPGVKIGRSSEDEVH